MYNGHFSFGEEIIERPSKLKPQNQRPRAKFSFRDRKWTVFEKSTKGAKITYVDGELPWVAKVGDNCSYMDAINPPYLLSAEWARKEMEWFEAEYIRPGEVAKAFGIEKKDLPSRRGVAPNQPFLVSPFLRQGPVLMLLFTVLFAVLTALAFTQPGKRVASWTLPPKDYAEEHLTEPFKITRPNAVCKAKFKANVDNSWVYLDAAVVNAKEEAVLDFSAQMSYYHGTDGGERWSEGSRKDSALFKLAEPGNYRFLFVGQAGTGENAGDVKQGPVVHVTVYEGAVLARYYIFCLVFSLAPFVLMQMRRSAFEKKRWDDADD